MLPPLKGGFMLAPVENTSQQFENFSKSIYNPHQWDRQTKKVDAERFRMRLEKFVAEQNLPSPVAHCMTRLYLISSKNYRTDGLIDLKFKEIYKILETNKPTFHRWIKELERKNLIVIIGSTHQRRICVKWERLQILP
jgi:hypothetical protein